MTTRGLGRVFRRPGSRYWWVSYSHRGAEIRESAETTKRSEAVALLKKRHEELGRGRPAREADKVTLADLRALIAGDYTVNRRRSGRRIDGAWAHVAAFFGERERAVSITAPRLASYVTARTNEGAAANTLRNELSALRRGFRLARETGALLPGEGPLTFPKVKPGRPRSGFLEPAEHAAIRAALPPDEGDVAEFLFWSGWRRSEATGLRWSDVDEAAGSIRIETTKTDEPRILPYAKLPALKALIEHRRQVTDAVQKKRDMVVSHVFHRNGEPIVTFYRSWAAACVKAGLGHEVRGPERKNRAGKVVKGRLIRRVIHRRPHDYRRGAARAFSRAGVPEQVTMKICGWKTRSVFDRYRVTNEADLAEGLERLAQSPPAVAGRKVARMSRGRS
jgi:integrase